MEQKLIEEIMYASIEESKKSINEDEGIHPKVGAILTDMEGNIILRAHRGETGNGNHCEYILIKKIEKLELDLINTILFVTLEPCTSRGVGKTPCAKRIVDSGIPKVYIGMLDPYPTICGRGESFLRDYTQVERYPSKLIKIIDEINKDFVNQHKQELLPNSSLYVSKQISDIMLDFIQRSGYKINDIYTEWDLSLDDIIENCKCKLGIRDIEIDNIIFEARSYSYDKKYCDYTYDDDYRGFNDLWQKEFRDILTILNISENISGYKIIDVGVGNGLEAKLIFNNVKELTLVDIAKDSLKRAKELIPHSNIIVSAAENLKSVSDESQDIYVSFRTYQSSYFDIKRSIREANRILKPNGTIIISIANGFIDQNKKIIPGLVIPKTQFIDKNRPYKLIDIIRNQLNLLRFENIGIRTGIGEIYIYGRRG